MSHWNKSTGPESIIHYPPDKNLITKDLLLKIWAQHELDKDNTMIELQVSAENEAFRKYISILQEYENEIYFLILIYEQKEEEVISPDILAIIGKNLLELMNTNKITRAISEAFTTINNYSKHESENLINFFQDKIKFTILQILEEGVISKSDLTNKLRQEYGFSTVNMDLLLISFLHENLIVKKIVPGFKECYFLINDLTYARIPPKKLPEIIKDDQILKRYQQELIQFFSNYEFTKEIQSKFLTGFLIDKDIYNLIKELRHRSFTVNECLNYLNNKEDLFTELLEKKIIFEAKGIIYLFADIRFIKFTPLYIAPLLKKRYQDQKISLDQYHAHLKLLLGKSPISNYIVI
ncbi:MAG: hypothetical protein ACTSV5_08870 [Promethearchaeota archaeon]